MNHRIAKFLLLYISTHLYFWSLQGVAQCPSPTQWGGTRAMGGFIIVGVEVGTQCVARPVGVQGNANVANARYIYDYKTPADTLKATTALSHTYTQPGPYYIVQMGTVNGRPSLFCNSIQVYATPPPSFTLAANCDATARLTLNTAGLIYGRYLINWGDGSPLQAVNATQNAIGHSYTVAGTYQIRVTGEGTVGLVGCNSSSAPQTFQASMLPLAIDNALATVKDNRWGQATVTLPTAVVPPKNYLFNGSPWSQNTWIDSTLNASQQSVCYEVSYTDRCSKSPTTSPRVCTVLLTAQDELLTWSTPSPFVQPVQQYAIERLDASGQVVRTYNTGTTTQWPIDPSDTDQEVQYRVKATSLTGQTSFSNTIKLARSVRMMVPDAFSPNNDQINDVFELKGSLIGKGVLKIYDRWGNLRYFADDWKKSWDGRDTNGNEVPTGFYTYRIEYVDLADNAYTKMGSVYVVR